MVQGTLWRSAFHCLDARVAIHILLDVESGNAEPDDLTQVIDEEELGGYQVQEISDPKARAFSVMSDDVAKH